MKEKIIEAVLMLIAALVASVPLKFIFNDNYVNTLIYTLIIFAIMYVLGIIIIPFIAELCLKHNSK